MGAQVTRLKSCGFLLLCFGMFASVGSVASYGQAESPELFQQRVPGLLGRTLFKTDVGALKIEVIDLLVGPEKTSEPISLNGGALLDVQAGEAILTINGTVQPIKPGD